MTEQQIGCSDVHVVEDERGLADLSVEWLDGEYTVRTGYNGKQAIEELGHTVDIDLPERSQPERSDDEILAHIREQDFDCRVVMVRAVKLDIDVLDPEFEDYLTKPVDRDGLRATIERMERLATYDELLQELYQYVTTRSILQEENDISITEHESCRDLLDRIATLQGQVDVTIKAFVTAFRDEADSYSHD